MDPATLIILILLLIMVAIPVIMSLRLAKSKTQRSPSPATASGGSPSGGGGSSGKSGNGIGYFFIPTVLATLWLVIRGVVSPPTHYSNIEIGIFIIVFVLTAINILVGKGASKWISLGLAVVMICIIWVNYNYINSSHPPTEQSAGQGQVATAPIPLEEEIDKRPIFPMTNSPIYLIRSGRYKIKPSKYRLYFSWLGYDTGYVNQWLKIDGLDYKATGREVYELNVTKDEIQVQFINPYQTDPKEDTYLVIRKEPGGQGLHPFLEPVQ